MDIESQSLDVMKQAAVSGSAVTVLPGPAIGDELKDGRLAVVDIDGVPPVRAAARHDDGAHLGIQRVESTNPEKPISP